MSVFISLLSLFLYGHDQCQCMFIVLGNIKRFVLQVTKRSLYGSDKWNTANWYLPTRSVISMILLDFIYDISGAQGCFYCLYHECCF